MKEKWCKGKGLCLKGGLKQIAVNKNSNDSKGVLESFIRTLPVNCWKLPNNNCWLLPNGEPWLLP